MQTVSWVRSWFGQEVARHNATRACIRMQHQRRQREELEAWLEHRVPLRLTPRPPGRAENRVRRPRSGSNLTNR